MKSSFAVALALMVATPVAQESARSVHRAQLEELGETGLAPPSQDLESARAFERGRAQSALDRSRVGLAAPNIADDFVVFGYLQSETQVFHLRWHALTHVGSRFVGFASNGSLTGTSAFTARSSYLRAGGAAEAAGVKVILVVNQFDDSPGGTLEAVMTDPTRRATLAAEIASLLASDSYSHGVSLDLEFSWGPAVRDGVTAFMATLRTELDTVDPNLELSIYTNAIFSAAQWDFDEATGITPSIDYMLYSMYDWATGLTAHAISDFDNCLGATRMHAYLNDGLPPEKLVPVVSAYSRRWNGTSVYNGAGTSSSSSGFTDALYDVTLNPTAGGPYSEDYVEGDEAGWYTWNDSSSHVRTWEALEGMEVEIAHALSLRDPAGTWNGRRLGGVGFWSLMWMAEFSSVDPRTGSAVGRTRTYPHVYQLCQELLSSPGQNHFLLDGFEGFDFRWRDPNESPDTVGDVEGDSSVTVSTAPAGAGGATTNALALTLDVEGLGSNTIVLAHELLASPLAAAVPDRNAYIGHVDSTTRLTVNVHIAAALPGYSVRLLVADKDGELEASPPAALDSAGWTELAWDLTQSAGAFLTAEPAFANGDGALATNGGGARDLGVFGFAIEGSGPADATIVFDELAYSDVDPAGQGYRINEVRYAGTALEFVELHGPAGALPAGLELRTYDSSNGSVLASIPASGAIVDSGDGFGFFVLGDAGVPNVDDSSGFAGSSDDLPDTDPGAVQLFGSADGHVFDSVVTEAFGGLDELVRPSTRGVTTNGYPWLGEAASGVDAFGAPYSLGRWPDGNDRRVNALDFSFQVATPGDSNGATLTLPASFDFETPPSGLFQTFDSPRFEDPVAAGLPASPNGGDAWRCVDAAGGGVLGVVGDASLNGRAGHEVEGYLWVPESTAPAQAVAVGLCGSSGSNFFTSTATDSSGYESGYFLVYENRLGVGLADGRADHPGTWELIHATNDNMDGEIAALLASASNATLGVAPGTWVKFELELSRAAGGHRLRVRIGGATVYDGPTPSGGPTTGAFQIAFRENHPGAPDANEGAWVDGLELRRSVAGRKRFAPRSPAPVDEQ